MPATKDLKLVPEAEQSLRQHAYSLYPEECCGFLLGTRDKGSMYVQAIFPVVNSAKGNKRQQYEISALSYLAAERTAEAKALSLIGVYHSHPDEPAIPSATDLLQALPDFYYLILSVRPPGIDTMRCWVLGAGGFEERSLSVVHYAIKPI